MTLTIEQLHILQHSLGVDQYGRGQMYRNHFCAGGADEDTCRTLVAMGYMWEWHPSYQEHYPYFNCSVTDEGKAAMIRESPPAPKISRSKRRYREFLTADTGCSFGEWLMDEKARKRPLETTTATFSSFFE